MYYRKNKEYLRIQHSKHPNGGCLGGFFFILKNMSIWGAGIGILGMEGEINKCWEILKSWKLSSFPPEFALFRKFKILSSTLKLMC